MSSYVAEHADAVRDLMAAGEAVTFTRATASLDSRGEPTGSNASTLTGYAIAKRGDPDRYERLGLKIEKALTLLVAPATHSAAFVAVGDTVSWNATPYTVKEVGPLVSPNGLVIIGTVVCA